MFPIAPNHGAGAGQITLIEKVTADAVHGGGLAGRPHPDVGTQPGVGNGGYEGIARA